MRAYRRRHLFFSLTGGFLLGAAIYGISSGRDGANEALSSAAASPSLTLTRPSQSAESRRRLTPDVRRLLTETPSPEQIEAFLGQRGRTAENLVLAYRLGWKDAHLREAMEMFPDDPRVAMVVLMHDVVPQEEALVWAQRLVAAEPDNAMAHYLMATVIADAKPEAALAALATGAECSDYSTHQTEELLGCISFYESVGVDPAEAAWIAASRLGSPHPGKLRKLAQTMVEQAEVLRDQGEIPGANATNAITLAFGQRLSDTQSLIIERLVGNWIERRVVDKLDPAEDYRFLGMSVSDYRSTLDERRAEVKAKQLPEVSTLMESMHSGADSVPSSELVYRVMLLGEERAWEWFRNRAHVDER